MNRFKNVYILIKNLWEDITNYELVDSFGYDWRNMVKYELDNYQKRKELP